MNGLGGLEGWRCLFIVEGIITVFLGFLVPFILLETPGLSTHLDADEKGSLVLRKQFRDRGATVSTEPWRFAGKDFAIILSCAAFYQHCRQDVKQSAGPAQRATSTGFMLMIANTAGVIESFMYIQSEGPRYHLRQRSLPFPFVEDKAKFPVFCTIPTASAT
ncbi:major facilitator superfamily transporter [Ilyonectria robusta]